MRRVSKIAKLLSLVLFLGFASRAALCTSHVFVLAKDGVWVASDTLIYHNDGQNVTKQTTCKVALSQQRIAFAAGEMDDFRKVIDEESRLPLADPDTTSKLLKHVLAMHPMEAAHVEHGPDGTSLLVAESAGFVQVRNGTFEAGLVDLTSDLNEALFRSVTLRIGVPHGIGRLVEKEHDIAFKIPEYAAKIAANPKQELIRILAAEARDPAAMVGQPFTVFLIHPDGSISDESDHRTCGIGQLKFVP